MRRRPSRLVPLLLVAALGCDAAVHWIETNVVPLPLPAARRAYAGTWRANDMELVIGTEGRVSYWRRDGSVERRLEAPLRAFRGDDLLVGIGGLTTSFRVDRPPWREDGVWRMVVEGVELKRVADGPAGDAPGAEPAPTRRTPGTRAAARGSAGPARRRA